jgi:PST family polysaccharide transporter
MPSDQPQALPAERATDHSVEAASCSDTPETSYGQILKSSAWIGGASVVTIGIGVIRTKAMAVILGPSGFGLMGLYSSIIDLALAAASMGIASAGVRQIAESVATGDEARIARTVIVLRRTAVVLGILAVVLLAAFAHPVSVLTFGNADYAGAVALLALAVFFRLLTAGQSALVQGMRRIHDLAAIGVVGALLGAMISIALVYLFREQGVAPSLVAAAAMGLIVSWWYAKRVKVPLPTMSRAEVSAEARSLLKLGFAFMLSGLLMMGASYGVRAIILRMDGLEEAGFYSAAWTLGGLYVGIILQAMGADFYPRLVGVAENNSECNRLVNEQTLVSLLLAGPGVIGTIIFAPLVITLFYSPEFSEAVEVLRWICLGIAMRTITWPMGFIIIAKNRQLFFIIAEVAWALVNITLTWVCVDAYGVNGAGMAFFGSYLFHLLLIYPIVRRLSGFRWSIQNVQTAVSMLVVLSFVFCGAYVLPPLPLMAFGALVLIATGVYSIRTLVKLVPWPRIPRRLRSALAWLRMGPEVKVQ